MGLALLVEASRGRAAASLLRHQLARGGAVRIVSPGELPTDAYAVPTGVVGSVTVFEEKPAGGGEFAHAIAAMEHHTGVACAAVVGFEAAGVSALLAALAAASLQLPLVDADGMGRAFPELEQTTFFLHGNPIAPVVVADEKGAVLVIGGVDGLAAERLTRAAVVTLGGWGLIALAPQRVGALAQTAIRRISRALDVGRRLGAGDHAGLLADYGGRALLCRSGHEIAAGEPGQSPSCRRRARVGRRGGSTLSAAAAGPVSRGSAAGVDLVRSESPLRA